MLEPAVEQGGGSCLHLDQHALEGGRDAKVPGEDLEQVGPPLGDLGEPVTEPVEFACNRPCAKYGETVPPL